MTDSAPSAVAAAVLVAVSLGCDAGTVGELPTPADGRRSPEARDARTQPGGDAGSAPVADAATTGDARAPADAGARPPRGAGGAAYRGEVLFVESFEDTDFEARGWYDAPGGVLTTDVGAPGSRRAFECRFERGGTLCADGSPSRREFDGREAVYVSYWVRYSEGWEGSGRPYHPHELLIVTNADDRYVGPAYTHLTAYVEQAGGVAVLGLQDSRNVDPNCVRLNGGGVVGCGGAFDSYAFTERRSVCACNGIVGDLDLSDCYAAGSGYWYSARFWRSTGRVFTDEPGTTGYESSWHFVEAYFRLNTIEDGVGLPNGAFRYWIDGVERIASDAVLLRTAQHPSMRFDQLIIGPFIGDGSPIEQSIYFDELTVAAGVIR